jgi:hypothetical protein
MFEPSSDEPWSFALSATQVAFAVYTLIATGYHQIVGFPTHYRAQLEESVKKHADLQLQKATIIPARYVKWYNILTVLVVLELGGVIGALVAELSGWNWSKGGLVGIALAALECLYPGVRHRRDVGNDKEVAGKLARGTWQEVSSLGRTKCRLINST